MKYTKQLFSIIAISLLSINLNAQIPEDVITGLDLRTRFTINGNNLYIGDYSGIYKMSINANQPRPKKILPNNHQMLKGSAFSGNFLYTNYEETRNSQNGSGSTIYNKYKIAKIDTSTDQPTTNDFFAAGPTDQIQDLVINGNMLYIADYGNSLILKADITVQSPSWTKVTDVTSNSNISMVVHGNYLYYVDYFTLNKINLTSSTPVKETIMSFDGMTFSSLALHRNNLYISEIALSAPTGTFNQRILKYDITRPNQDPDIAFDNIMAGHLNVSEDYLYMRLIDKGFAKISRINLNPQPKNDQSANNSIKIIPSPATNYIRLRGTNLEVSASYIIYNSQGQSILRGLTSSGSRINIQALSSGKYTLRIDGKAPAMFAKN